MSEQHRSNLLIGLAGVAALLIAWGSGYYLAALNNSQEQRHQRYRYAADKPAEINSTRPARINTDSYEYRAPCDDPKSRDESELCAQWRAAKAGEQSAFWAKWSFWVTTSGILGLLITIIQSRVALDRAREANDIAKIAVSANRPWIDIELAVTDIPYMEDDSLHIPISLTFTNFGSEFAVDFGHGINVFDQFQKLDGQKTNTARDSLLAQARRGRQAILAPSRPIITEQTLRVPASSGTTDKKGRRIYLISITVLAIYRSPSLDELRTTMRSFAISDPKYGAVAPLRSDDLPKSIKGIKVIHWIQGNIAT